MRDLALSLVTVCVLACGAKPAATVLGGDVSAGTCAPDLACSAGGGQGSLLQPTAVIGAAVLGVAAVAYVYHLVRPPARVTLSPSRGVP